MRVVIAGGHGQIALKLEKLLSARGDQAVGIVRNPGHVADLEAAGAEVVVLDLEKSDVDAVAKVLDGADAAIFAAGAGPGSGTARKDTVDRAAAELFAAASERAGVRRHIQVGSMGADKWETADVSDEFRVYLKAKKAAEDDLRARDLDWTILRPGQLTNDEGTGKVLIAESTGRGPIPRQDVAAILVALLDNPSTAGRVLEAISGDTAISQAFSAL
ncbi:NAD(P)H-binding protein [Amycolatopsis keratiniphila]|uniref:NAD(P)H-binding protein n=1 Tax=Amycolatopsis keratiniphila TaxID=129921 RepID=UPI0008794520|nr:NAD(P)H-binding protein [Amycolatopsis keratiniphila]OLZ59831.1 NAD-dependent dehydratase [Amycolatopsis keratiniphila subsp. nogabecina]SDU55722.1 Putative NADH-flavin reductase [Amycolatopsis keratiniphila]